MENKDNLLGILGTLVRWRRSILRVVLITIIGSLIVTLLLDNYYQSTTTFYVASPDLFKPEQMFGNSQKDMDYYGTENDVDRVLTIAQSGELYEFLIKRFDLYKHYKIDSAGEKASFKVREALEKLYEVKKTKFNAIELSVEDKDKKLAAEMSNAARQKIDEIAQRLIRESQAKLIRAYEQSFKEKSLLLQGLGDSLSFLRQTYGVIDPATQTEAVTQAAVEAENSYIRNKTKYDILKGNPSVSRDSLTMLEANVRGFEEEVKRSGQTLQKYTQGFNGVSALKQYYEDERNQTSRDNQRYQQLKIAFGTQISALHLIEAASPAVEKSRPKRSVWVLTATFLSLVFSVFGILLFDGYRRIDWAKLEAMGKDENDSDDKKKGIGFFNKNN